jgi:hypothetical protein
VLDENEVKSYRIRQKLNELIKTLQFLINGAVSGKIFFFIFQQVTFDADQSIAEIKKHIVREAFFVAETFHIFKSHYIVECHKVFVFEDPIVGDKILKGEICFVNFSLDFCETKNKTNIVLNFKIDSKISFCFLQLFFSFKFQHNID